MGDEILEIPLDITEEVSENPEEIKVEPAEIEADEAVIIPIKPKAKGRPKGSPNKGPSKPRAKKIKEAPVDEDTPHAYAPSSPKRNHKLPTDPTSNDIAAEMLRLLQDQTYSRQSRKQRLYNSWFQ